MGSVELGGENSWLPHPEEQLFLDQLYTFMDQQGSPIIKVPNLGFKKSQFVFRSFVFVFVCPKTSAYPECSVLKRLTLTGESSENRQVGGSELVV